MKNLIITIILASSGLSLSAQIKFDIVAGVSPGTSPATPGVTINRHLPHEEFVFNLNKVDPQFLAGVKSRVELSEPFFMDAGLFYARRISTYGVVYTIVDQEHPVSKHLMKETDHTVMLPVNVGVNMGSVDITSGFRVIQSIRKKTDLQNLPGFNIDSNRPLFGWQAGAGISFLRSRIGLEFQGNFARAGHDMFVDGQSMELINVPGQLILMFQHSI